MNEFDLNDLPSDAGNTLLLEASAGTGKTYTLVSIYLHYLVIHKMSIDHLLVVTFTEAATREMKQRIHDRVSALLHSVNLIRGGEVTLDDVAIQSEDSELLGILTDDEERYEHLVTANLFLSNTDIQTIHGFCHQILKQYPVETGCGIDQELAEDLSELKIKACLDYWRARVIPLPNETQLFAHTHLVSPQNLAQMLNTVLNRRPDRIDPIQCSEFSSWLDAYDEARMQCQNLQSILLEYGEVFQEWIKSDVLKRSKDKLRWWKQILDWAQGKPVEVFVSGSNKKQNLFERFTLTQVKNELKAKKEIPEHISRGILEPITEAVAGHTTNVSAHLKGEAIIWARSQYQKLKRQLNLVDFDDLIITLSSLIEDPNVSQSLKARLSERYKVALIDEFQDTDGHQFSIFSNLFEKANLVLVGDPKQAIYAFRGGDISTYLQAKQKASGQVFSLSINFRSTKRMVDSVNHIFQMTRHPFILKDIEFKPVQAASPSLEGGLTIDALSGSASNKAQLYHDLSQVALARVMDALDAGIDPSDIAILVRQGSEAYEVRKRFSEAGLETQFSGRSELHRSPEAYSMLLMLRAINRSDDSDLLKQFIAEPDWLIPDEQISLYLEHIQTQLWKIENWAELGQWRALIQHIFTTLDTVSRWKEFLEEHHYEDKFRTWGLLIDALEHIAEGSYSLAQTLEVFEHELLRPHHLTAATSYSDNQIRILTFHKSKGLEFDHVFIPFLFSSLEADKGWRYEHQQNSRSKLIFDLGAEARAGAEATHASDHDAMAEDARLLYVALTRARSKCFVGTALYQGGRGRSIGFADTAFGRLLLGSVDAHNSDLTEDSFRSVLASLSDPLSVTWWDSEKLKDIMNDIVSGDARKETETPGWARKAGRVSQFERYFGLLPASHSFSSLLKDHQQVEYATRFSQMNPVVETEQAEQTRLTSEELSIMTFPRGASAGTFLHHIFENLDFNSLALPSRLSLQFQSRREWIEYELAASDLLEEDQVEPWAEYIDHWVATVFKLPLVSGFCLSDLKAKDYQREMPFVIEVKQAKLDVINKLFTERLSGWIEMKWQDFKGYLVGSVDLIFEHKGQFFVADYKSNYLGDLSEHYSDTSMDVVMHEHHYDLQYVIYLLALHRLLKNRLGSRYRPEQDLGGVLYLFLRGLHFNMQREEANMARPGVYLRKIGADLIEDLDRLLEGECIDG